MTKIDDRTFVAEPFTRIRRVYQDPFAAATDVIVSHQMKMDDPKLRKDGWVWRPYLELWSWRVAGAPGALRNVTMSFRPVDEPPPGATPAARILALGTEAPQFTIFESLGIHIATFVPGNPRGIPFPMDDAGPWTLWVGSLAAAAAASFTAQIGYHPIRMSGC